MFPAHEPDSGGDGMVVAVGRWPVEGLVGNGFLGMPVPGAARRPNPAAVRDSLFVLRPDHHGVAADPVGRVATVRPFDK